MSNLLIGIRLVAWYKKDDMTLKFSMVLALSLFSGIALLVFLLLPFFIAKEKTYEPPRNISIPRATPEGNVSYFVNQPMQLNSISLWTHDVFNPKDGNPLFSAFHLFTDIKRDRHCTSIVGLNGIKACEAEISRQYFLPKSIFIEQISTCNSKNCTTNIILPSDQYPNIQLSDINSSFSTLIQSQTPSRLFKEHVELYYDSLAPLEFSWRPILLKILVCRR